MSLLDTFKNPPREYTIIPFWFLNDDLTEEELRRQIDDFEAHGVYGFIPHARMGLSDSIGFMSDAWLHFTKVCVEHAARKDMTVILYDEGMYPSGSCAGQVVAANPRHATRCLERRKESALSGGEEILAKDDQWVYVHCRSMGTIRGVHYGEDDGQPGAPPSGDLLNPEAVASFLHLALDRQYESLKEHFGKTVIAIFTDEPSVLGRGGKKNVKPWTWGFDEFLHEYLGYDFRPHVAALWDAAHPDAAHSDAARYRRDFQRAINKRLDQAYYARYSQWCSDHGVALAGHPAAPDDIGVLKHFHIPGQDIVWRYIEPFKDKSLEGDQSTMAKCSVSAQRHYGRARNANECFGAYGWEFTFDEMRYITNWLFVRGVNLIIPHAFYYSLREKRRDERPPDAGPNSPWWKDYKSYADYCRRLSWLLANGQHICHFAILGTPVALPWRAARAMFETQHDFNYLDTDTLNTQCTVSDKAITIRDMTYQVLILDGPGFADDKTLDRLKPMIDAGRVIAYRDPLPGIPRTANDAADLARILDTIVFPDVAISPSNPNLRYIHMKHTEADVYLFANEGKDPIDAKVYVAASPAKQWWDPWTAEVIENAPPDHLELASLDTKILIV